MKQPELHLIFPTPVLFNHLCRDLSKIETNYLNKELSLLHKNTGNHFSTNTYVLDNKKLKNLKTLIEEHLKYYVFKVMKVDEDITPYVTQSWLNINRKKDFHHFHNHPNSFISGVLYLVADKNQDSITFHNPKSSYFGYDVSEYERWNCNKQIFNVESGYIVLFPSTLHHTVKVKEDNKERVSLAFNSFIKGTLGKERSLQQLKL